MEVFTLDRDYRKSVIEWNVDVLRSFNLSDNTIGFYLRALHVHTPIYLIISMCTTQHFAWAVFLLLCLAIAFVFFVLFDGCILSKIEKKLDGQDITIVDPFLEIFGVEKTTQARMRLSYFFAVGYIVFMLGIFYQRFLSS